MINEVYRKLIHLSALAIPIGIYLTSREVAITVLGILGGLCLIVDAARMFHPGLKSLFYTIFGRLLRREEEKKLTGATSVFIGALCSVILFSKPVAVLALLFLILGDTAAALIGKRFGRIKIFGKTLEGSLACLAVCSVVVIAVPLIDDRKISLIGAITATLIELLPVKLDDNITIPLISGAMMRILIQ